MKRSYFSQQMPVWKNASAVSTGSKTIATKDPEVAALKRVFDEHRLVTKFPANWKWMRTEWKKAYEKVHGKPYGKKVSGSLLSEFLKRHEIVILKKENTNKESKSISERLPCVMRYHHHIIELRASVRADRPEQPRDPVGVGSLGKTHTALTNTPSS